jgi:hypothetical protein
MKNAKHRNGVRYSETMRNRARTLRAAGKTHREIVKELGISLGTADIWTRGIVLSSLQQRDIQARRHQHICTLRDRENVARRLKSYWRPIKLKRQDLLLRISEFYLQNGRIPLKREFNSYELFKKEFGSWNGAIIAAGFDPNPVLFAKKFISRDHHSCDSFTEKIIDDWLLEKGIEHQRHWHYGDTKMTADFFIQPNIIVEFFGLAGVQTHYDVILQRKRSFCLEYDLRLIELYPKDVFPINKLEYLIEEIISAA